jgi:hypothetical protein
MAFNIKHITTTQVLINLICNQNYAIIAIAYLGCQTVVFFYQKKSTGDECFLSPNATASQPFL